MPHMPSAPSARRRARLLPNIVAGVLSRERLSPRRSVVLSER